MKQKRSLLNFITHHLRSLCFAAGEMLRQPLSSFLTVLVIAISFALPFGLNQIVKSVAPIGRQINRPPNITVYVTPGTSEERISALKIQLQKLPQTQHLNYISPTTGLKNFNEYAHLSDITQDLPNNPLPAVFILTPQLQYQSPASLSAIITQINQIPDIDSSQLNMTWVKRLFSIIAFSQRIIYTLGCIFGLGVFVIVGNTIRLITQQNQEDINIMRLFGASPNFIRRPLLYRGLLLGFCGGLLSWVLVTLTLTWLTQPLNSLVQSYQSTLSHYAFDMKLCLSICFYSTTLAGLGAWFAVTPHLKKPLDQ